MTRKGEQEQEGGQRLTHKAEVRKVNAVADFPGFLFLGTTRL